MHVFVDDSGSFGREGFICLAGLIAHDSNWNSLNEEWSTALTKHRLPRLHTADFIAGRSEYRDANLSDEERRSIIGDFMRIIRRYVSAAVVVGMESSKYRSLLSEEKKKLSPQHFLFYRLLRRSHDQMRKWGFDEPISFVFDDNRKESPRFYDSWSRLKSTDRFSRHSMAGITFADDVLMPPLQAADLLAYAIMKDRNRGIAPWATESAFSPMFLDDAHEFQEVDVQQEFWPEDELEARKAEILALAKNS